MKPEDIRKMTDIAREMVLDQGTVPPALFLRTKDEGMVVVELPELTPETKYKTMFMLGLAFKRRKVSSVAFVSKAWMVRTKGRESPLKLPISEHPEKEEVLLVIWGTKKGKYRSKAYLIQQTPDGPVFTEEAEPERVESYLLDTFFDGLESKD